MADKVFDVGGVDATADTDARDDIESNCREPIESCPIVNTPHRFSYDTCEEFECYDVLAICIEPGEDSIFELQSSLSSIGKFICSDTNVSSCMASGATCDGGVCCILDQLAAVGSCKRSAGPIG